MIFARHNLLLCILTAVSLPGVLSAQQGSFLYVPGNTIAGSVAGYSVDASGALVPIPGSPFPTTVDNVPNRPLTAFAADPSGRFLYIGMPVDFFPTLPPRIAALAINPLTGALTAVPGSLVTVDDWVQYGTSSVQYMTVSPTGRFLYAKFGPFGLSPSDT